jgi:hypothetical protein
MRLIGVEVAHHRILEKLGDGGMGVVLACNASIGRSRYRELRF